jgi:hypothetical protein
MDKEIEACMYRIVKRIVHTITTVTLLVRWEDSARQETLEKQITLPASHSVKEEEVVDEISDSKNNRRSSNPTLEYEASPKRDQGEKS